LTNTQNPTNLEALVDRHIRLREVRRKAEPEKSDSTEGPWLTLSRQYGAGGTALAHRLSEELGWQLFNREILQGIAENTHIRMRVLSGMDERILGQLEEYIQYLVVPETINQAAFAKEMMQVILTLGRKGHAVLLGRGANWLLSGGRGIRVRIVAPLEYRVEAIASRLGIRPDRAREEIQARDAATAAFIQKTFGREIDDPTGYDMILNLAGLAEPAAAAAVRAALRSLETGRDGDPVTS